MIIGCDIGGVVKDMLSDSPIPKAIETIKELENLGHQVIFISKCKDNFKKIISEWLVKNNLESNKVFFCNEYSEKCDICLKNNVNYMIDDKLQVFKDIPDLIKKIWLTNDKQKIEGAKKYQPNEIAKVNICKDWNEIVQLILFL
jgi:hypothetical protein